VRARAHLQNLWKISQRERTAYLRERFDNGLIRAGKLIGFTPESPQSAPDRPVAEHQQRVDAALYEAYQYYKLTPQSVNVLFLTADTPPDWPTVRFDDPLMGWGPALRGRISQCSIPGTHLSIFAPGNLPVLAERVRAGLAHAERVERGESSGLVAVGKAS
jgi:thioesterase domain-containing protein